MTAHFLPLHWLMPAWLLRFAERHIYAACESEDQACEVAS